MSRGEGTRTLQCGKLCPCSASSGSVLGPEGTAGLWVMTKVTHTQHIGLAGILSQLQSSSWSHVPAWCQQGPW